MKSKKPSRPKPRKPKPPRKPTKPRRPQPSPIAPEDHDGGEPSASPPDDDEPQRSVARKREVAVLKQSITKVSEELARLRKRLSRL